MRASIAARRARLSKKLRAWWPELTAAAVVGLIAIAPVGGAWFLGGFSGTLMTIGWLMARRHKSLPLGDKIDGLTDMVRQSLADDEDQDEASRPRLSVVRG